MRGESQPGGTQRRRGGRNQRVCWTRWRGASSDLRPKVPGSVPAQNFSSKCASKASLFCFHIIERCQPEMDEWMVWRREGGGGAAPPPDAPLGRRATPTAARSGTPLSPRGQRCPSGLCSQPPAAFSGGGGGRRWFPVVFAGVRLVVLVFPPVELMIRTTCFIN